MAGFLHRPQGTDALPTTGSIARPELAVRAVLKTADGGVLVTSVQRQSGGAFSGEVYGVTPRERHVAVGDRVTFSESQIFTYKTAGADGTSPDEVARAEMIRAFGESFRDAAAPNAERVAVEGLTARDFAFDAGTPPTPPAAPRPEQAPPPPPLGRPPPAAAAEEIPRAPPRVPPTSEPEISVDDAYAILRGAEPAPVEPPQAPVEPMREVEPKPTENEAPVAAPVAVEPIMCLECGATLVVPVAQGESRPSKVSCNACGRINDVDQAEAATRRRLRSLQSR